MVYLLNVDKPFYDTYKLCLFLPFNSIAIWTLSDIIHSKFDQRLTLDDITNKYETFNFNYVMEMRAKNQWGDSKYWDTCNNDFIKWWNHFLPQVIVQKKMNELIMIC